MSQSRRRFVIINGDDFGFSSSVNHAIIKAHEQGILTSASLMVTGEAFDEAVALAQAHPKLAVGLHLVLICGQAVLPPSQIPHLVDSTGSFSFNPLTAGLRYQFHPAARRELHWEIRAQLQKFCQMGLPLDHVDGHLHLHCHPVILQILVDLADEFNIKAIRLPSEELSFTLKLDKGDLLTKLVYSAVFSRLRSYGERKLKAKGIGFAERVYGLLQNSRISEEYLVGLIPQIQADLVEIYSHPGLTIPTESWANSGEGSKISHQVYPELDALLSDKVREALFGCGFELTNYKEVEAIKYL